MTQSEVVVNSVLFFFSQLRSNHWLVNSEEFCSLVLTEVRYSISYYRLNIPAMWKTQKLVKRKYFTNINTREESLNFDGRYHVLVTIMSFALNTVWVLNQVEYTRIFLASLRDATQPPILYPAPVSRYRRSPFLARNWGWNPAAERSDCYPAPPIDWMESSSDCDWFD